MSVEEEIKELMSISFMVDKNLLKDDYKLEDLGVDSLGAFELAVALEDRYGLKLEHLNGIIGLTVKEAVIEIKKLIS
jgi:acyl carrier protein